LGRSRYKYYSNQNGPYFLTCTLIKFVVLFGITEIKQIVIDSLRFLIENERIELHGFVIMEHHLHLIVTGDRISKEIGIFKSFTARKMIEYLIEDNFKNILYLMNFFKKFHKKTQEYQAWEEGSHPKLIVDLKMLNQKLDYIHNNPVRSGYVDDPLHWRYSSCRYYHGLDCLLPITVLS